MNTVNSPPGAPTAILKAEHEVILRVLGAFETMLKQIEKGTPPDAEWLGKAVDFFRGYADRVHHAKEEDHLFPAMEESGMPREGGPVGVMLEEHDQGRAYIRGVVDALQALDSEPAESRTKILNNGWA